MRRLILLLLLSACVQTDNAAPTEAARPKLTVTGKLADPRLVEASGIASSRRQSGVLWLINDGGAKPRLHAIDNRGADRGSVKVDRARNVDWEDLASFTLEDNPYLLIADIGDNDAKREVLSLYVVAEPLPGQDDGQEIEPVWRIDFTYPDGPRDAEAAAVDVINERIYVLSKRDIPALLYELPLRPQSDEILTATRLGPVKSLPRPSRSDVEYAPVAKSWHWQPTAMDIAADNSSVIIMTYRALYVYDRTDGDDLLDAIASTPQVIGLGNFPEAESAAFGGDSETVFITIERKHAPLLRIDLSGEFRQ